GEWQSNGVNIANATNSIYQVQAADEGNQIRVVVTSHDTDGSGTSTTSNAASAVFTVPPTPTITSFKPDTGVKGDFITAPHNLTLTRNAPDNATIQVFDRPALVGQVTSDGSGSWSLFVHDLANGSHNFTAEAIFSGKASAASPILTVTIDPNAPEHPPVVSASNFNVLQDQAVSV